MKHATISFRRLFSALLVVVMLLASVPAMAASKGDIIKVSGDYARLRAQPKSGSVVLSKVRKGTKAIYLGQKSGWVKIELSNGKTGYMYKSMLSGYSAPKVGKLYKSRLSSGKLAVYAKPNSKSKKLGTLKNSSTVVLLGRKGFWGKIRVVKTGGVGYVNVKYLRSSK